jgi:predicted DNA-binding protein (MmcQ/YjbR family)
MTLEFFRNHCLALPAVTEDTPFNPTTLCFRLGGKIFALMDMEVFEYVNLKCDPERSVELRERYDGITPGYHMNKKLWNSVSMRGNVPDSLILELAVHSYELIRDSLPKKVRENLE